MKNITISFPFPPGNTVTIDNTIANCETFREALGRES